MSQVLPEIIQIASSTLSDCLQLVDDTIRSIFADTSPSTTENSDEQQHSWNGTIRCTRCRTNQYVSIGFVAGEYI